MNQRMQRKPMSIVSPPNPPQWLKKGRELYEKYRTNNLEQLKRFSKLGLDEMNSIIKAYQLWACCGGPQNILQKEMSQLDIKALRRILEVQSKKWNISGVFRDISSYVGSWLRADTSQIAMVVPGYTKICELQPYAQSEQNQDHSLFGNQKKPQGKKEE